MTAKAFKFHLPLSDELDELLRGEAECSSLSATALARQALAEWLQQRLFDEIAAYAQRNAGTALDLDESLEEATLASLAEDAAAIDLGA